jgi:HK97 family phage prohead protease
MPYFITDQAAECSGWAVVKDDGEAIGCHDTKQGAIDQMVAVSIAEGIEPGGERSAEVAERRAKTVVEYRTIDTEPLELRAVDGGVGTFSGYAIRYNSPSLPLPFTEFVAPGAVTRSLRSRNDIRMYLNHSDLHPLASTRSKTLRLEDRPDGLWVEADLPDTSYARDLRELMDRDIVRTMSFGFSTVKDSWSDDGAERTLNEIRLHEVSVVTGVAAYPATSAAVRSMLVPAIRSKVDADALSMAVEIMLAGEQLSGEQAAMLRQVIAALSNEDSHDDSSDLSDEPGMSIDEVLTAPRSLPMSMLRDRLALRERTIKGF